MNYKKDIGPEVIEASGDYDPPADCSILGREVEFSCYVVGTGTVIRIIGMDHFKTAPLRVLQAR